MKMRLILGFVILSLIFPSLVFAHIGVGVATGKIVVQDKLKPGITYHLPPLTVVNTGDEVSDYGAGINYLQNQKELMPGKDWFVFSPQEFRLNPGKVQIVEVTLNIPVSAKPGDYFAFVEGFPVKKTQSGAATISVAAASKLYFTIIPANIFQALYYKANSIWVLSQPWANWLLVIMLIAIAMLFINKFFHIEINLKKKESAHSRHEENE